MGRLLDSFSAQSGTACMQDHGFGLIMMEKGSEGHTLHGSSGPGFDPHQYYVFKGGKMHTGLTVVAWQFADVNPGDGGLAVVSTPAICRCL